MIEQLNGEDYGVFDVLLLLWSCRVWDNVAYMIAAILGFLGLYALIGRYVDEQEIQPEE